MIGGERGVGVDERGKAGGDGGDGFRRADRPCCHCAHGDLVRGLVVEMVGKALTLGIPLSVQLDLTYRCNERCIHCYLDHDDHGEMTTAEIKNLLDQMADAGVFYLTISGGEILMRRDFFEILEHARAAGIHKLTGTYRPTDRNKLVAGH